RSRLIPQRLSNPGSGCLHLGRDRLPSRQAEGARVPKPPTTITDELGIAFGNLRDAAVAPFTPTLRLGVTGLSRSGKTIFITALIHNLLTGGRLPGFAPLAEGRFIGAHLTQYPDAAIPRFAYEQHLE